MAAPSTKLNTVSNAFADISFPCYFPRAILSIVIYIDKLRAVSMASNLVTYWVYMHMNIINKLPRLMFRLAYLRNRLNFARVMSDELNTVPIHNIQLHAQAAHTSPIYECRVNNLITRVSALTSLVTFYNHIQNNASAFTTMNSLMLEMLRRCILT